jgi:hypothetical protein
VALPPIVWLVRDAKTTYGMLGCVKAFSIHDHGSKHVLDPRLPDPKGLAIQSEEHRTLEKAKARAEAIREEWLSLLDTPYEGQLRRTLPCSCLMDRVSRARWPALWPGVSVSSLVRCRWHGSCRGNYVECSRP